MLKHVLRFARALRGIFPFSAAGLCILALSGSAFWIQGLKRADVVLLAAGFIDVMDKLRPELIEVMGAGVVGVEASGLLGRPETGLAREKPLLLLGESELVIGRITQARRTLELGAASIPKAEVLLRARIEALLGQVCEAQEDMTNALRHYQEALQRHPGVMRSLGIALPVKISTRGGTAAAQAASMLRPSPRFAGAGRGFIISIVESGGSLTGTFAAPDGATICQVCSVSNGDPVQSARAFCRELHRGAFAVRIDLAQTDIASIEGSNLTGESVRRQIRDLFQK